MISAKEHAIERAIKAFIKKDTSCYQVMKVLFDDSELHEMQEYANTVSIRRLGYNDHGPVHMRQVAYNAIRMLSLLRDAGIKTNLESEESGTYEDSLCTVFMAAFLHDIGMSIGRENHEKMSCMLAIPIIDRTLAQVFPSDLHRRVAIRSIVLEGIIGHMGTQRIHSIEAGLILVADGCDMTKGRARIPMMLNTLPRIGDIHKYSANSIEHVDIKKGDEKPIQIEVEMSGDVGFFQIEEVLIPKIDSSPARKFLELYAGVPGHEKKRYL